MTATVLSGTSGALYYKPAGTVATFGEAGVDFATDTFTVATYLNFKVGDPVKFSIVNAQTGGAGTGTLPAPLSAATTYYVISYTATTGALQVSTTAGGTVIALADDGTAAAPNEFQVAYADYGVVASVRDWSFEISRSELDVTTIGQTPGQYAPFKTYIAGFADGSGSATVYMTDEDAALSNRMIEDVLQRKQVGCSFKLYTDRVLSGGTVSDAASRSISMNAVLTSASLSIDPDNAQSVAINFRPADGVSFDISAS
jgi:hypothetical protein